MTANDGQTLQARPLSHFLTMLVLSILGPAIALTGMLIWWSGKLDRDRVSQQALYLAQAATNDIDREIDGSIETLLALATSHALASGDLDGFHRQAVEAMQFRKRHVLLRGRDGQQILNTRVPFGTPFAAQSMAESDRQVFATGQPMISDLVRGAVADRWVIGLSVPVRLGGQIRYVLTKSLEPDLFQRLIAAIPPAPGWIIALSDSNGRLIARSHEHAEFLGLEMHPSVRASSTEVQGVHRTMSLMGEEVVRGYAKSSKTRWMAAALIRSRIVDAPLRTLWFMFGAITLAIFLIAGPAAIFLRRQIADPIAAAALAAARLGRGERAILPAASRLQEANQLATALDRASIDLEARSRSLVESEQRFRSVFEQSAVGFEQVGMDGKLLGVNDRLCRLLGYTREECLQKTFKLLTHPDDWAEEDSLINSILQGEKPYYETEKRLITKAGDPVWVRVTSAAVRDSDGKVLYRTSVVEDVNERRKARQAAARLAAIVQASPDAMMSTDLQGNIETWNPGAETMFGYTGEDIIGKPMMLLTIRAALDNFRGYLNAIANGETVTLEAKWRHKDGNVIDVAVTAAPIYSKDEITAISVTAEDIRDRKRREHHVALLNKELAHRVKNTLAVIQSIANQTMRSTPDPMGFRFAFQGRLQALSAANDLLMHSNWEGAELSDFIDRQLAPLMSRSSMQLNKAGPSVRLPAETTVHLGLALHELGTNAIKHGAWSVPEGQVRVTWHVTDAPDSDAQRLVLVWSEHDGPPVLQPSRAGFGTTLIEKGIPEAIVKREFKPEGLVCTMSLALPAARPEFPG